jgi:translation initiation factor 3 subunit M
MATADSVSVFAEGTFEEQIQELVDYATRSNPEDERATALQSFRDITKPTEGAKPIEQDQERKRNALTFVLDQTQSLGDGSEQEIEGYFNLLFSHLLTLWPVNSPEIEHHVSSLLGVLASSPSEHPSVRYRVISNLFNATPRNSALRLPIYTALLQVAAANGELETLRLTRKDVEQWLQEWDISGEERSQFLRSIVDAFIQSGQPETAYQYTLSYVASLPPSSPEGQTAAIDAIALALRLPSLFDLDPLFKLDAVVSAKDHELFSLLQVFLNSGLSEFHSWLESHPAVLEKYELDRAQLERKIRLLSFASLGFAHVGHDLPYSEVASILQIELNQVEKWAIDVIRTGLLSGKLSQTTQSLHVYRSSARAFEREQWEALEKRLVAWKMGLASVLEVVTSAQKRGNSSAVSEVVQQVTQTGESVQVDVA